MAPLHGKSKKTKKKGKKKKEGNDKFRADRDNDESDHDVEPIRDDDDDYSQESFSGALMDDYGDDDSYSNSSDDHFATGNDGVSQKRDPSGKSMKSKENDYGTDDEDEKKNKKKKGGLFSRLFGGRKKNKDKNDDDGKEKKEEYPSDGDIEENDMDEESLMQSYSVVAPEDSYRSTNSYSVHILDDVSEDDGSQSHSTYDVVDDVSPAKSISPKKRTKKGKQEKYQLQMPGVSEEEDEDDQSSNDSPIMTPPDYPDSSEKKSVKVKSKASEYTSPERSPQPKKSPKRKKNPAGRKKGGTGTKSATKEKGYSSSPEPSSGMGESPEHLRNEILRLKTLNELMMTRMELYERQSECLVEASLDHNRNWKLAAIENYDRKAKRRSKQSANAARLSAIKGLLEERSIMDQWIRQLEDVQRGYKERLVTTQEHLKTVRYEQLQTNKKIVELKQTKEFASRNGNTNLPTGNTNDNGESNDNNDDDAAVPLAQTRNSTGDVVTIPPIWSEADLDSGWNSDGGTRIEKKATAKPTTPHQGSIKGLLGKGKITSPVRPRRTPSMLEDLVSDWHAEGKHISHMVRTGRPMSEIVPGTYNDDSDGESIGGIEDGKKKKKKSKKEKKSKKKKDVDSRLYTLGSGDEMENAMIFDD